MLFRRKHIYNNISKYLLTYYFKYGIISKKVLAIEYQFQMESEVKMLRKMSDEKARRTNGGWIIYTCIYCKYKVMVDWVFYKYIPGCYQSKPDKCPRCGSNPV